LSIRYFLVQLRPYEEGESHFAHPTVPWEDPEIFPMKLRIVMAVVPEGGRFSGWSHYFGDDRTALPGRKLLFDVGPITIPDELQLDVGWGQPPADQPARGAEYQTKVALPHFDWTQPYDYVRGRIYQRVEILERPGERRFVCNQQMQEDGFNGDHWWPGREWIEVITTGVYETSHRVQSMRDARGLLERLDDPPPLRMAFAVQGAGGHPNSPWNQTDIYPMTLRFTWVAVAEGYEFPGWDTFIESRDPLAVETRQNTPSKNAFLGQNHPNPFNSSTAFWFTLPERAWMNLVIYSLAGQRVATLAEGIRDRGAHVARWDGRDKSGGKLASGVYVCRLQAGDWVYTRKLMLLR